MPGKKHNERGAGRKPKFDEPTKPVTFKVPVSKIKEIKAEVYKLLEKYKKPK